MDPRTRQALLLAAGFEAGLRVAALIDLAQRPSADVHGGRARWGLALAAVNSFGVLPIASFLRGRRRPS